MEYELKIHCEDCTTKEREKPGNSWYVETFYSLTSAVQHIVQTGHEVKIELETVTSEE